MKLLWCWRCKAELPMLDDEEFEQVTSLRDTRIKPLLQQFQHVLQEYERITGLRETNQNAIYHHKLSLYGPPCSNCGKPLRSARAKLCGACMHPVAI